MNTTNYKIEVTYDQILELVDQLSDSDKDNLLNFLRNGQKNYNELDVRLSKILDSFKTNKISEKEIEYEVEKVRSEIYEKRSHY